MKKVLFWDFDGTLVLPDAKWSNAMYFAVTNRKYNISIEEIRNHLHAGYTWHTPEIAYTESIGQKWWDNLFIHFDLFYENHKIVKSDAKKINAHLKSQILNYKNYTLYVDTVSVLQSCAQMGYKNYILSNNFPELPFVIKELGLSKYFTDYIVSANIGYEKPRIEIFKYALNIANFPETCYMIGDNPIADIQGGKSVGMKTVLVHREGVFDTDFKCENLSEIPLLMTS